MVALNPRGGESTTGSPTDPAHILAILDLALQDEDVTVSRLRQLRQALEDGDVTDIPEEDLAWIERFLDPAHVCMYDDTLTEESTTSIHGGTDPAADPAIDLAKEQLQAIGWGQLDGNRILDPDALIEEHGALTVLYAVWCSKGKAIRNRPAFVTWWLREGHEAPEGWLPTELRQGAPENAQDDADASEALSPAPEPQALPEPETRPQEAPELPQTPEPLQPTREELLAHIEPQVRPSSFDAWIRPLALMSIDDGELILQAPDGFHAQWVRRQFARAIERACKALGFTGYRLTTPTTNTV